MDKHLYWNKPWSNQPFPHFGFRELEATQFFFIILSSATSIIFLLFFSYLNRDEWEILNHLKRVEFRINIRTIAEHFDNNPTHAEYLINNIETLEYSSITTNLFFSNQAFNISFMEWSVKSEELRLRIGQASRDAGHPNWYIKMLKSRSNNENGHLW